MSTEQKTDYKKTLNLPQTTLPMKANAATKEVETQTWWKENEIYLKGLKNKDVNHKFILHDGPPYLSSDKIHIGTALNKILKDIVVKYKAQCGYYSPYVPGYDGHGLPIENAVVKKIKGGKSAISATDLRKKCREFAYNNLKGQEENFKRLGVLGHWEEPYVTIDPKFEATQIRVFSKIAERGLVNKGLKPVYWCADCETALAEAEVEYADHTSHSIYVKFTLTSEDAQKAYSKAGITSDKELAAVIWTTTPWTLPANLAVALHPKFTYSFIETTKYPEVLVIAKELVENFLKDLEIEENEYKILGETQGESFELLKAKHPFFDRESLLILGDHVTTEAGTGCVHTAPGHGLEDYEVGNKYKIGVVSPVNNKGIFTEEAHQFEGMHYSKANTAIIETMQENKSLLKASKLSHSYPHCWRCKHPVIYRATEQWFVNVEKFREKAVDAIDNVKWIPESGHTRIRNMVESRSDWCISRQRSWGVPIPVFYCDDCGETLLSSTIIEHVAKIFEVESSDAWWGRETKDLLPQDTKCSCGSESFRKELDIMDVWFDSGVTHAAVVDARPELLRGSPVELYLEGSDQHRGWFQTSLLTSVATKDEAPYKNVLTHGFVLDGEGKKMSKSMGNVVDPQKIVGQFGADVLRMWAASVDYRNDVRISDTIIKQLVEVYRKIRNTCRFILGNINDFDPNKNSVAYEDLNELDKYILHKFQAVKKQITEAFEQYEFYKYYQIIQNFVAVDLSSLYFDIVKDILYTAGTDSRRRRAVQTVLHTLLQDIVRMIVPVTPHQAEDIWNHTPEMQKNGIESVLLTNWPKVNNEFINDEICQKWEKIFAIRDIVTKTIEPVRSKKIIGSSLECKVSVYTSDETLRAGLESVKEDLKNVFIVSQLELSTKKPSNNEDTALNFYEESGITVLVEKAEGEKCPRCWKYANDIGIDTENPSICGNCSKAIQ